MAQGKKTGGRGKGTPNVITKELRKALKLVVQNELENLSTHLDDLESKERLEVLVKLLPYILPKVETTHMYEGEYERKKDDWRL